MISGKKVVLTTREYRDGKPGEISIEGDSGSESQEMLNKFAEGISMGLQHGVPLATFVGMFAEFGIGSPGFVVGHPCIRKCVGIIDFVFRDLGIYYLNRKDLASSSSRRWKGKKGTGEVVQFSQK